MLRIISVEFVKKKAVTGLVLGLDFNPDRLVPSSPAGGHVWDRILLHSVLSPKKRASTRLI